MFCSIQDSFGTFQFQITEGNKQNENDKLHFDIGIIKHIFVITTCVYTCDELQMKCSE